MERKKAVIEAGHAIEQTSKERFQKFRSVILKAVSQAREHLSEWEHAGSFEYKEGEIACLVTTPTITQKSAGIFLFKVTASGQDPFYCVAKSNRAVGEDAESVKAVCEGISGHAAVAQVVPEVYEVGNEYFFMERLFGLEERAVVGKIEADRRFAELYAEKSFQLTEYLARQGVWMSDIHFLMGHNVMVDPDTMKLRFVEITNALPIEKRPLETPDELIFLQATNELSAYLGISDQMVAFLFFFLRRMMRSLPKEKWVWRNPAILPSDPWYESFVTERERDRRPLFFLDREEDGKHAVLLTSNFSFTYSEAFIKAIEDGDEETFRAIFRAKKWKQQISNEEDPRHCKYLV